MILIMIGNAQNVILKKYRWAKKKQDNKIVTKDTMKHILETYKDNELPEQVKGKLENTSNFKDLLQVHSQLKKINKDWEIGIKIRGQK